MRALVLQDSPLDASAVARALESGGFAAEVYSGADPWPRIAADPPELLVIDWGVRGTGLELVKRVRTQLKTHEPTYVLMVTSHVKPAEISAAYQAGVDDLARRPASTEEIVGRAAGARRLRDHLKHALASALQAEAEMAKLIERLPAWRSVDEVTCKELVSMLNLQMHAEAFDGIPPGAHGSTVRLSLPSEALDVRLTLFVEEGSLGALGEMLLGESLSEAQRTDLLFEMVNTAAGAFRRELNAENITLTSGLPRSVSAEAARATTSGALVSRSGVLVADDVKIVYLLSCAPSTNDRVPAKQLREGMVVVRSVFNGAGAMLVPAGTRITKSMASRVAEALGPDEAIEVSMEAA